MKIRNVLKKSNLIICATSLLTCPILVFNAVSCQSNDGRIAQIEFLQISADRKYVTSGSKLQIKKDIEPYEARNQDLKWEILTPVDGVTLSQEGVVSVDANFRPANPISIVVKATSIESDLIQSELELYVVNQTSSDFIGILDGKVQFEDREDKLKSVNVIKTSPNVYETDGFVDIFATGMIAVMDFTPVFKGNNTKMKFHMVNDYCASWADYRDSDWTDTVPHLMALYPSSHRGSIEVTFACDYTIKFIIHLHCWRSPVNINQSNVYMLHDKEKDGHELIESADSTFDVTLRCNPSFDEPYDYLETVYMFRDGYQYLELEFRRQFRGTIDPDLKIELEKQIPETWNLPYVYREYDDYPAYKFDFGSISFSNKNVFNPAKFSYRKVHLFSLIGRDPIGQGTDACELSFYLSWDYE